MARKTNYEKNGVKYFRVTTTYGHDEKGKPLRKEFYGISEKDAIAKRDAFLADLKAGLDLDMSAMTVANALHSWLFEVKKMDHDLKPTSFSRYEVVERLYIQTSEFGKMQVGDVRSIHIQRYLNSLSAAGKSNAQMKNVMKVLKMFFIYATGEGYTLKNPCYRIAIPGEKPKDEDIETFTAEEIERIKAVLNGHRLRFLILLALGTGMRKGELLALRYEDIKDGRIHVHSSLARPATIGKDGKKTYKFVVWEPKTKNANRYIPMPASLEKELALHKVQQMKERMSIGINSKPDYVFTTETGNFIDLINANTAFKRILKRAGVPKRKFHTLRHTYATEICKNVDLAAAQKLLGHSTISMTSRYVHPSTDHLKESVQCLNAWFQ